MTRAVALNELKAGISRIRTKGGANPEVLYDLLNGYVTQDGSVVSRPGTVKDYVLPADTKGLCAVNGGLVVFSDSPKTVPAGVECAVLRHPSDANLTLHAIHFAGPFLGDASGAILYVVAEFNNGDVFHYWLRTATTWAATTAHKPGDLVEPSTANGYLYRAHRAGVPYPAWAADVDRSLGDKIEPTQANGFYYEVTDLTADPTPSGETEPTWPEVDGGTVNEYSVETDDPTATPTDPSDTTLPDDVADRYANRYRSGA